MPEILHAPIGALLCAGNGSRLFRGLEERGEVQVTDGQPVFTDSGNPYEKSLTSVVKPDQNVEGDTGVVTLDLAVKDMLLTSIEHLRFLTNKESNIPRRYGHAIDRAAFLGRLGLPVPDISSISPKVTCEYIEQPPKTDDYPFYGTAWAIHLVSKGVELGRKELMMITETDSMFLDHKGVSIPAYMIQAMQGNRRGATAALNVSPLRPDIALSNGLGMVLMEQEGDEYYFRHVIESEDHADLSEVTASGKQFGKNTTRIAADATMLAINEDTVQQKPLAANGGELQATDSYNEYPNKRPLLAVLNPEGVIWLDMGKLPGLLAVREALNGLSDANNPVWHQKVA